MRQVESNVTFVEGHSFNISSNDKIKFEKLRKSFVEEIVSNLQSRFAQTSAISSMSILDHQHIPKDQTKLLTYGNSELDVLIDYFSVQCPTISNLECKQE